jgi:hypothetical protein
LNVVTNFLNVVTNFLNVVTNFLNVVTNFLIRSLTTRDQVVNMSCKSLTRLTTSGGVVEHVQKSSSGTHPGGGVLGGVPEVVQNVVGNTPPGGGVLEVVLEVVRNTSGNTPPGGGVLGGVLNTFWSTSGNTLRNPLREGVSRTTPRIEGDPPGVPKCPATPGSAMDLGDIFQVNQSLIRRPPCSGVPWEGRSGGCSGGCPGRVFRRLFRRVSGRGVPEGVPEGCSGGCSGGCPEQGVLEGVPEGVPGGRSGGCPGTGSGGWLLEGRLTTLRWHLRWTCDLPHVPTCMCLALMWMRVG